MKVTLITGRTIKQGKLVDGGKLEMEKTLAFCEMSPPDMRKLSIREGDFAVLQTNNEEIIVEVKANNDLPEGIIFAPISPLINRLIPYSKSKRGILSGKGVEVNVTKK
ncbi:MAG: molybdopterin dinucleotide binding domain-containing protein [Candidatus Odinarchaeia archaeon]